MREIMKRRRARLKKERLDFEKEFRQRNAQLARELSGKYPWLFPKPKKKKERQS